MTFVLVWSKRWEYRVKCCWGKRWNKKLWESGNSIRWKAIRTSKQGGTIVGVLTRTLCLENLKCYLALMSIFTPWLCMRAEEVKRLIAKLLVQSILLFTNIFAFNLSIRSSLQLILTWISPLFLSIPGKEIVLRAKSFNLCFEMLMPQTFEELVLYWFSDKGAFLQASPYPREWLHILCLDVFSRCGLWEMARLQD